MALRTRAPTTSRLSKHARFDISASSASQGGSASLLSPEQTIISFDAASLASNIADLHVLMSRVHKEKYNVEAQEKCLEAARRQLCMAAETVVTVNEGLQARKKGNQARIARMERQLRLLKQNRENFSIGAS